MLLKARHSEPRDALVSVAYALLGIYAVTVIAAALPLQLLQPAWIERVCGSLRGGVSFPLIALVFLVMAQSPRTRDVEPASSIRLRRLSSAVALGFVLMVPLQTWAGVQVVRLNLRAERQQLLPISRGLERIRLAESEEALLGALASLPGAPPNLSGSLREPLAVVRQRLIAEIEPQLRARETRINDLGRQLWQEGLLRWVKDAAVALFAAMAFATIGRARPHSNRLFEAYGGDADARSDERLATPSPLAASVTSAMAAPAGLFRGLFARRGSLSQKREISDYFDRLQPPDESQERQDRSS